jgi:hypothetical protein
MFEITKNILTSPVWTIATTIIFWVVIYRLFVFLKLSETNWKRLEYTWIFIGLFGLLTVIEKNNKEFRATDNYYLKQDIKFNLSRINFFLSDIQSCFKYNKLPSSPQDFDDRQHDQDLICSWAKQYKIEIDTLESIPTKPLDTLTIRQIAFKTSFMDDYVKEFNSCCSIINKDIEMFNKYRQEINASNWENFSRTTGVLLIILAFSIRLSITTKNVKTAKKNAT